MSKEDNHNDPKSLREWATSMVTRAKRLTSEEKSRLISLTTSMVANGAWRGDISERLVRDVPDAREVFDDLYL